jgi:DNA-binding winged helix-turn-helix (wHTH) protein/TolB-like protein
MPRVRFGLFDFDPASGELRREAVPVRLQAQPAQVLGVLISQAGEVVTRETLREAVWGSGTVVDFERGLNFCIAQIRAALGDSADSPRFIRTVPKRGYQFIAPVETNSPAAIAPRPQKPRWAVPAAVAAALMLGGAALVLATRPAPAPTIAVCRFDNQTGEPALDRFADALADNVVAELTSAEAGRYGVIGNAAILRRPRAERDLSAIGTTLHSGHVVIGQVQRDGDRLRVLAHLIRLPQQTHLTVARFDGLAAEPLPDPAGLAREVAARFHSRLTSTGK